MEIKTKCGICGLEFTYDDQMVVNPFTKPRSEGAKYYYNLWHINVERCPHCDFVAKKVSSTYNKKIVEDEKYQGIKEMDIIKELNEARPNRVESYLLAAYYYESIGDTLNNAKCLLQAGDLLYAELMYWDEYVLDDGDSISAIISKRHYNELKGFADNIFNTAIERLENFVKDNPNDIDAVLLLGGTLCDGDKVQAIKGSRYLNSLKNMSLNSAQKVTLDWLFENLI